MIFEKICHGEAKSAVRAALVLGAPISAEGLI
jgi:hypothetical protein